MTSVGRPLILKFSRIRARPTGLGPLAWDGRSRPLPAAADPCVAAAAKGRRRVEELSPISTSPTLEPPAVPSGRRAWSFPELDGSALGGEKCTAVPLANRAPGHPFPVARVLTLRKTGDTLRSPPTPIELTADPEPDPEEGDQRQDAEEDDGLEPEADRDEPEGVEPDGENAEAAGPEAGESGEADDHSDTEPSSAETRKYPFRNRHPTKTLTYDSLGQPSITPRHK